MIPREKGDLTIDLQDVAEAKLQIRRYNGPIVEEGFEVKQGGDNTLTLRAGEYEVKLVDADSHQLVLSTNSIKDNKACVCQPQSFNTNRQRRHARWRGRAI